MDRRAGFFASKSIKAPYQSYLVKNEEAYIGPHGDKRVYDDMVQNEVIPNKMLHIPFVLGFTAPVVPLMYDKSACPVLLFNLAGLSSLGKSTSLMLIASIWGKGIISNSRLAIAKTFASTQNGFEAAVNANNGLPVLFDDYETACRDIAFGKLIYTLSSGESKIRCDKKGHVVDTHQWRTTIGLTGESSIFDRAGENSGLRPRIVEFQNEAWTASKQNSINISGTVMENYGFYGELFAEKLAKTKKSDLDKLYKRCERKINKAIPPKDNISDRIQTRLALIAMTAGLVKKFLNLNIDVDFVIDFLVNNEKKRQQQKSVSDKAKDTLIQFINTNLTNFVRHDASQQYVNVPNLKIFGRIYNGSQGELCAIIKDEFRKIMDKFNDRDAILSKWKDEKFLICDKGNRFTKKTRITGYAQPCDCYVVVFKDDNNLVDNLSKQDEINIKNMEIEDYYNKCQEVPKVEKIFKNGNEYCLIPPKPVLNEVPKKGTRDEHNEYITNKPVKVDDSSKLGELDCSFDDSEAIDEIFKEDKSDEE